MARGARGPCAAQDGAWRVGQGDEAGCAVLVMHCLYLFVTFVEHHDRARSEALRETFFS